MKDRKCTCAICKARLIVLCLTGLLLLAGMVDGSFSSAISISVEDTTNGGTTTTTVISGATGTTTLIVFNIAGNPASPFGQAHIDPETGFNSPPGFSSVVAYSDTDSNLSQQDLSSLLFQNLTGPGIKVSKTILIVTPDSGIISPDLNLSEDLPGFIPVESGPEPASLLNTTFAGPIVNTPVLFLQPLDGKEFTNQISFRPAVIPQFSI